MDHSYLQQKMKHMFKFSADSEEVKSVAKHLISKRDDKHVKHLVEHDDALNPNHERDIEAKLKKWRLKERKHDFHERIQ
jgi:hypothetical protein